MVTKSFSVKLSRIRNKKDSEYFAYRINIPKTVADELELEDKDRVFCKIQKAEWYHTLDWSTMEKTWDGLPSNIQQQIQEGGFACRKRIYMFTKMQVFLQELVLSHRKTKQISKIFRIGELDKITIQVKHTPKNTKFMRSCPNSKVTNTWASFSDHTDLKARLAS